MYVSPFDCLNFYLFIYFILIYKTSSIPRGPDPWPPAKPNRTLSSLPSFTHWSIIHSLIVPSPPFCPLSFHTLLQPIQIIVNLSICGCKSTKILSRVVFNFIYVKGYLFAHFVQLLILVKNSSKDMEPLGGNILFSDTNLETFLYKASQTF